MFNYRKDVYVIKGSVSPSVIEKIHRSKCIFKPVTFIKATIDTEYGILTRYYIRVSANDCTRWTTDPSRNEYFQGFSTSDINPSNCIRQESNIGTFHIIEYMTTIMAYVVYL